VESCGLIFRTLTRSVTPIATTKDQSAPTNIQTKNLVRPIGFESCRGYQSLRPSDGN